jgi:tRNA threonylcarbamoyladenosine biosynthesis protein TsaB
VDSKNGWGRCPGRFWWILADEGYAVVMDAAKILLIDACGEAAGVALCRGGEVLGSEGLPERGASAGIVAAVRRLLAMQGWKAGELDGVGVVNGPGSFTGVRAGVAAAKGLCEAGALKLAAVSRLAVLCEVAALCEGFAVLRAGRGEVYVRDAASKREWTIAQQDFVSFANGASVVVSEKSVEEMLRELRPRLYELRVSDALGLVQRALNDGGIDVALLDANYVRGEEEIYKKAGAVQ